MYVISAQWHSMAVSWHQQIRKILLKDDASKYRDHDFLLPYKTIPDGSMILSHN